MVHQAKKPVRDCGTQPKRDKHSVVFSSGSVDRAELFFFQVYCCSRLLLLLLCWFTTVRMAFDCLGWWLFIRWSVHLLGTPPRVEQTCRMNSVGRSRPIDHPAQGRDGSVDKRRSSHTRRVDRWWISSQLKSGRHLLLPLGSSILEPGFDLDFCQRQVFRQFHSLVDAQVFINLNDERAIKFIFENLTWSWESYISLSGVLGRENKLFAKPN